ncbi:hypothetical protein DB30_01577 [Enhygromyxa salina]|uniref:Uncharacterized protein n=1 Tax=Enhygromyxa salina TaxID=215803 RepID=A0A0C2CRT2_9BACT|nr:hypothetical protein DB30_01577 [Enhygromyxa salina]
MDRRWPLRKGRTGVWRGVSTTHNLQKLLPVTFPAHLDNR